MVKGERMLSKQRVLCKQGKKMVDFHSR
jgi:hypothetical protein